MKLPTIPNLKPKVLSAAVIILIVLVVVGIADYGLNLRQQPTTPLSQQQTQTIVEQPFYFQITVSDTSGRTLHPLSSGIYEVRLCANNRPYQLLLQVAPVSGNPRSVSLVVQDVQSVSADIGGPITLSQMLATPPFDSVLTITASSVFRQNGGSYIMTVVGDDFIGQTYSIAIHLVYACILL